jgi:pimeloyl-ACP methyl ester carboxylesterase
VRKWLPVIPILIALGVSAATFGALPNDVRPDWGQLLPIGASDEVMGRTGFALLMPMVAIGVWALMAGLARVRGSREGVLREQLASQAIERFEPTYHIIVLAVVSLIVLMHLALVANALGWPAWTIKGVGVVLGAGLFLVGNLMPRLRPNWIAGIRTRATLSDPSLWLRTHRYFGGLLMLAGVVVIVVALVAVRYALTVMIAGFLASAVLAHVWAAMRGGRTAAAMTLCAALAFSSKVKGQMTQANESAFDIKAAGLTLPGTLILPAQPRPDAVVIVAGSGPTDRNGNGPLIQTDMYKQIGRELADSGFASLRYDKRGIGASAMTIDHTALTIDDYVRDATAAVDALIADGRFGRIFLLGHSEGAMLSVLAANRGARVGGVIMLSGTGRKLADVLHEQFSRQVDAATVARIDTAFATFVRGGTPVDPPVIAAPILVPQYRRMLASMAAYDPPKEVAALTRAPLVIGGSTDIQVTQKDFEALRASRPDGAFELIQGANHVFKHVESLEPAVQQPLYMNPKLPVVPELVPAMVRWLRHK